MYQEIYEYLKVLEEYSLPDYKELPSIPLYMEQAVSYISETLEPLFDNKDQILTPFMINNYVKAKIIAPPDHKKYSKNHLGYLFAISILKNVASIKDLATLIAVDNKYFKPEDKQNLYNKFKTIQDEVVKNEAHKTKSRLDLLNKKKLDADDELSKLAFIALRLYIESEASKLIADSMIKRISETMFTPKEVEEKARRDKENENKRINDEANKLKNAKK